MSDRVDSCGTCRIGVTIDPSLDNHVSLIGGREHNVAAGRHAILGTGLFILAIGSAAVGQESMGDRPIYFAATAPPVYEQWNLQPHLIRHGLAHRLPEAEIVPSDTVVQLDPQFIIQWIDVERTDRLIWDVFRLDYLFDWPIWPEPSTRASIPAQYYIAHLALAAARDLQGDVEEAERAAQRGDRLLQLRGLSIP